MMPFMVGQLWLSTENISLYISLVCCGTSILLPLQEGDLGIAVIILEENSNKIPIFTALFLSISTPQFAPCFLPSCFLQITCPKYQQPARQPTYSPSGRKQLLQTLNLSPHPTHISTFFNVTFFLT